MGALLGVAAGAQERQQTVSSAPAPTASRCRISGRITSANAPLPGVSVVVHVGDSVRAATSTAVDGTYTILFTPNAAYHLSADFSGFVGAARDLVLAAPPCDETIDFQLALAPRTASMTHAAPAESTDVSAATPPPAAGADSAGQGRGAAARSAGGRGAQSSGRGQRFQPLNVQAD